MMMMILGMELFILKLYEWALRGITVDDVPLATAIRLQMLAQRNTDVVD